MTKEDFKIKLDNFSAKVIILVDELPETIQGNLLGNQLFISSTTASVNYRKALNSKDKQEFVSKLKKVGDMVEESAYWLEMIDLSGIIDNAQVKNLISEAKEISGSIMLTQKSSKLDNDILMNRVVVDL